MAEETNAFTLKQVIDGITEKLIARHPHVFGSTTVTGSEHVKENWEKLKMKEGRESVVDGVPREMPALLRAFRLQDKASKVGFDWRKKEDAWTKVSEELAELQQAITNKSSDEIEDEFGDLLFSLVNYARFIHVNPEVALRSTVDKFVKRFKYIETKLKERGKDIHSASFEEMDALWDEAKKS